jgi:multidrug efflux pump subunit AcrB
MTDSLPAIIDAVQRLLESPTTGGFVLCLVTLGGVGYLVKLVITSFLPRLDRLEEGMANLNLTAQANGKQLEGVVEELKEVVNCLQANNEPRVKPWPQHTHTQRGRN